MSFDKNSFNIKVDGLNIAPLRFKKKVVCEMLGVSVNQLRKISLADKTFPKPLKSGTSRQSAVYYDYKEIVDWHLNQLSLR